MAHTFSERSWSFVREYVDAGLTGKTNDLVLLADQLKSEHPSFGVIAFTYASALIRKVVGDGIGFRPEWDTLWKFAVPYFSRWDSVFVTGSERFVSVLLVAMDTLPREENRRFFVEHRFRSDETMVALGCILSNLGQFDNLKPYLQQTILDAARQSSG